MFPKPLEQLGGKRAGRRAVPKLVPLEPQGHPYTAEIRDDLERAAEPHHPDLLRRARERALQKRFELRRQALDGREVVQARVVFPLQVVPVTVVFYDEREVELRDTWVHSKRADLEVGQLQFSFGRVLKHEHCLKHRRAAHVPLHLERLDELLEGDVLMGIGAQSDFLHIGEQVLERVGVEAKAEREGVDEKADEPLRLDERAIRDGTAHDDVRLSGIPRKKHLPGSEQHHKKRRAFVATQLLQRISEISAERQRKAGASMAPNTRTRSVHRKLERGRRAR